MSNRRLSTTSTKFTKLNLFWRSLWAAIFTGLLFPNISSAPTLAQLQQLNEHCQVSSQAAKAKENLRVSAFNGNKDARYKYDELRQKHAQLVQDCRKRNWLQVQAIWLRLYPCDMQPGAIDRIMDKIVNRGYNQVYLEAFYDGRVLLPQDTNPTIWPSVVSTPVTVSSSEIGSVDLLAQGIQKGRERGLKVYAWMFTTNFGYSYAQHQDRENSIARNGKGQTSLYVVNDGSQVFIDPYNEQAKADYKLMVQEILQRRPDGLLFDYVRYPRQTGKNSIATKVTDLWLYSDATQQALFKRAQNNKGLDFIQRFLNKGYVTTGDIAEVDELYPTEAEPLWQGQGHNNLDRQKSTLPIKLRQRQLQNDLWLLSVAHAMQGIVDFVASVSLPAENLGLSTGAVFFPDANKIIGQGYDSRLQPWDRFPSSMEWHPMSYADCGNTDCIATQVQQVLTQAKPGTQIIPALAGTWGKTISNRPPLEAQMQALRKFAPQIKGVSHFAFSWQFPEQDGDRKFCRK
jgi:Glycosyl hydrolase-like 10